MLGSSHGSFSVTPFTWETTHGSVPGANPGLIVQPGQSAPHHCACPICHLRRALREANNALDALAEKATERDMAASHLRSEVEAALNSRRPIRWRLRRALEAGS